MDRIQWMANRFLETLQILLESQIHPVSVPELMEALAASDIPVTAEGLYPLMQTLRDEGYLASSLLLEPGGVRTRRYWLTQKGLQSLKGILARTRMLHPEVDPAFRWPEG